MELKVKKLNAQVPNLEYKTAGAVGCDLVTIEQAVIAPREVRLLRTGINLVIPDGYEGQLRLRSSMGKKGLTMPNAPATIDSDFRGEVSVLVANIGGSNVSLMAYERVAQLIISPVVRAKVVYVNEEEFEQYSTVRGVGGFGSTGRQ